MPQTTIQADTCKGCALCASVCPKQIISMEPHVLNRKGYHPAVIRDMQACIGCAMCAEICPDCAITVAR